MKYLFTFAIFFISFNTFAAYTGNHRSTVTWVKIYNNDTIFFGLEQMPTDHQCTVNYFVLSRDLTSEQRERYVSMLYAARVSKMEVSVGYDKQNPHCQENRVFVHALQM